MKAKKIRVKIIGKTKKTVAKKIKSDSLINDTHKCCEKIRAGFNELIKNGHI